MPHQCTNCGHTFPDGSKEMLSGCPDCGGNKFQFTPNSDRSAEDGADGDADDETPAADSTEAKADGVASRAAETVRGWVSSEPTDESTPDAPEPPAADRSTASADTADPQPTGDSRGSEPTRNERSTSPGDRSRASDDEDDSFTEWPDSARRPEDRSSPSTESTASDATDDRTSSELNSSDHRTDPIADASSERSGPDHETAAVADSEDSAQASARSEVVPADDLPTGSDVAGEGDPITEVDPIDDGGSEETPDHGRVVSEPSGEQPSIEELRAELNEQFESIKILRPGQYELNLMELYNRDEYIISLQEDGRYVIDVPESWHDDVDE
ncbi:OapC/ArvC family zinc-ribbon domain-containing protein [Natronococcus roseus]|uniref:OapC/ArvC family zinc-ribbon domain-containing protein n=1 Tax=Natronococcus roseus TaxID=1052014 RepID=UPI00374D7A9F